MSFPVYPDYKDSGVEWVGSVPSTWRMLLGKRLFQNSRASAEPGAEQLAATQAYGVIPQIEFMEQQGNKVVLALSGTENFKNVQVGDFVISLRSFQGGLEYSAYDGCVSPAYTVLRPTRMSDFQPRFFRFLLKADEYIAALQSVTTGIREGRTITFDQFGSLLLPVPPAAEQTQIARFLDYETARIDALIEEQQCLMELLKEKRQAVISLAVTKGLDPAAPMKESGKEWLGEVPAHWEVKKLKYGVNVLGGFAFQSSDFIDEGVQLIKIGNLYENEFQLDRQPTYLSSSFLKSHSAWVVSRGNLLMSLTGTLGKRDYGFAVLIDCDGSFLLNQRVAKLEIYDLFDTFFLKFLLHSDGYLNKIYSLPSGTKQANLSNDDVVGVEVSVPPLKEQKVIADFLVSETGKFASLIKDAELVIEILKERRSALISAAVTGKIDVRGWHPPAGTQTAVQELEEAV